MWKLRMLVVGSAVGVILALTSVGAVQEQDKSPGKTTDKAADKARDKARDKTRDKTTDKTRDKTDKTTGGFGERIIYLVPPTIAEELNLSEEQTAMVKKLENEFKAARRQQLMLTGIKIARLIEASEAGEEDGERPPILEVAHEVTGALLELKRGRAVYEKKALAHFKPEQRQKYLEYKRGSGRRGGGDGILSRDTRRLKLTPEQRQKLREVVERGLREILTDEQKKLLNRPDEKSKRK